MSSVHSVTHVLGLYPPAPLSSRGEGGEDHGDGLEKILETMLEKVLQTSSRRFWLTLVERILVDVGREDSG
jgi:hypothetical protein